MQKQTLKNRIAPPRFERGVAGSKALHDYLYTTGLSQRGDSNSRSEDYNPLHNQPMLRRHVRLSPSALGSLWASSPSLSGKWTLRGLNPRHPPCKGGSLPLTYGPSDLLEVSTSTTPVPPHTLQLILPSRLPPHAWQGIKAISTQPYALALSPSQSRRVL